MNINQVVLTGNLTRDPESFADGKVTKFGLAVNEREKKGDEWVDRASFFEVTCFGKTGENVRQYMSKGSPVAIAGRLRQERWQTDSGDNRSKVVVNASVVQFLGSRDDNGSKPTETIGGIDQSTTGETSVDDARTAAAAATATPVETKSQDDDIPF